MSVPMPGTSTGFCRPNTKAGTLRKVTLSHLPFRHCASTGTRPPGASRVSRVTGSRIATIPVSSNAVAVQIVLVPDIGT